MSGRTAIRGFTYQTISSVIQSLSRNDWDFVNVEPDTTNDKVDILWERNDGKKFCQQVKSSINNFTKADIIKWVEQIIADVPEAEKYELMLIGNMSTGTDEFIRMMNDKTSSISISQNIDRYKGRVKIDIIVFKLDFLESKIRDEVSRFLSAANYHLSHATIVMIAGGLIYQFFQFSVLGSRVSRDEFAEHLLGWVKSNYSRDLGLETRRSKFNILIYDKANRTFSDSIQPSKIHLDHKPFTNPFVSKVLELCRTVSAIDLPERTKVPPDYTVLTGLASFSALGNLSDADVSSGRREFVTKKLKDWFRIEVKSNFFNVGNLKQGLMTLMMPGMGPGYSGTEQEKKKGNAIMDLYWELHPMNELRVLIDFLNEQYWICLIIENAGSSYDQELTVNLMIPNEVEIVTPSKFYIPDDRDALDALIEGRFARQLLGIEADSLVKEYTFGPFMDIDAAGDLDLIYKLHGGSKLLELKKDKFRYRLARMMDFEAYNDMPGFTQLRYKFDQLNPGIKLAFPSTLLFKAENDFVIGYEITTKHSSVLHKGELRCIMAAR